MKKFLSRKVFGLPVWVWSVLALATSIIFDKIWVMFFGGSAAALALRQAANEASDKADALIQEAAEQWKQDQSDDNSVDARSDAAKLEVLNKVADNQDSDSEYME